ncbi:uncharacterized protein LOC129599053 [Paramacrobiotus metropolitanus]|uniref:uncharacterized protein LOC129599053 n=1 Tax=Paramacrobiotus metropolitanus TaxID=2943436 RepID=UPI002445ACA5|nr:uncharacterized protein LOC129599053 [Paramacrobiotus metropolitanus]
MLGSMSWIRSYRRRTRMRCWLKSTRDRTSLNTNFHSVFSSLVFLFALVNRAGAKAPRIIFRDDFDGVALDLTHWNSANTKSNVNGERQYYRSDNVQVSSGTLRLISRREAYGGCNFTSGLVDTRDKFSFLYGEIEWRARVAADGGIQPQLWLQNPQCHDGVPCNGYGPPSFSPRMDGDLKPSHSPRAVVNIHNLSRTVREKMADPKQDLSNDFHMYKIVWSPNALQWLVDGKQVHSVLGQDKVPAVAQQVVMNVAVKEDSADDPGSLTRFPTEFLIDYVVVRQYDILILSSVTSAPITQVATPEPTEPPGLVIGLGSLGGTLVVTAIGVLILFMCWKQRRRLKRGNMRKRTDTLPKTNCHRGQLVDADNEEVIPAIQQYIHLLEIPLANIQVWAIVGKGKHGIVRKGVATGLRGQPLPTLVAIKTARNTTSPEQQRQIITEMKVLTQAGRHLNIINLLGAVVKGETHLLLEYAEHGSLLKYLRFHRRTVAHNFPNVVPVLRNDEAEGGRQQQFTVSEIPMPVLRAEVVDGGVLSVQNLMGFVFQISRGMAYLNSRSIIHCDLAARNILVCHDGVVKIADFGMARQATEYTLLAERVRTIRGRPHAGLASESRRQQQFTVSEIPMPVLRAEVVDGGVLSVQNLMGFVFQISRGMAYLNSRSIIHCDLAARNILVCHDGVVKIADFGMARQATEYTLLAERISRGMAYLNSRSIIHCDLAARNILVCHDGVVKIADFGMARQATEYTLLAERGALPLRWMAPESIEQRTFSQKSDVWSFGVLTWEIFSLSEAPYTCDGLNFRNGTELLTALMAGVHLEHPPVCPNAVYVGRRS